MKIVQLTPYAMDRPGGVQSNIRDLAGWCRTQGHEVRIVAPPGDPAHTEAGLMTVGSARPWSIHGTSFEVSRATHREIKDTVSELREWGAEVVHMHTPWTPLLPWQIWRALKLPSIATFHATLPENAGFDPMPAALRRVGNYFNRRISRVVVPSMAPYRQWETAGANPVPAILPPTIDLFEWRAAGEAANTSKTFRVVYMGRLEARKGVSVLLNAWRTVATNVPNAELIIAGAGEEDSALRTQAADLPNVSFQPPPSDAQARSLIASADVFAAPALHGESFGLVLIEAMAAGTLPVAAANQGFATVMTGAGAELLVPPGDATALTQTLVKLANDPNKRAHLTKWASKHAMEFDVATVGPEYVKLYAQALAAPT